MGFTHAVNEINIIFATCGSIKRAAFNY